MKRKDTKAQAENLCCGNAAQRCSVISWGVRSKHWYIALRKFKNGKTCLEEHSREGETPVRRGRVGTHKHTLSEESSCLRVQLKERWYTPSEAKHWWETDSEQVPWGKDEKNSEKRVQRAWSCWNGRNLIYYAFIRNNWGLCAHKHAISGFLKIEVYWERLKRGLKGSARVYDSSRFLTSC